MSDGPLYWKYVTICPLCHHAGWICEKCKLPVHCQDSTHRNKHTKFDNTKFRYVGRSYGVGSSVGLVDTEWTDHDVNLGYSYQEQGYTSSAECIYNESSRWEIEKMMDKGSLKALPNIFLAHGYFPNSDWDVINKSPGFPESYDGLDFYSLVDLDDGKV